MNNTYMLSDESENMGMVKFKEFSEHWLEKYARPKLKATTVGDYESKLRIINEGLGNVSLNRINAKKISDFCNNLSNDDKLVKAGKSHAKCDFDELLVQYSMTFSDVVKKASVAPSTITSIRQNKNVEFKTAQAIAKAIGIPYEDMFETLPQNNRTQKTVKNYLHLISSILSVAVTCGCMEFNPAKSVALTVEAPQKKGEPITVEELAVICEHLETESPKWKTGMHIVIHTSISRGELLGLEWKDFDFPNNAVNIGRASQAISKLGIVELSGADFKDKRSIKLNDTLMLLLKEYQQWQQEEVKRQGDKWCRVFEVTLPDGAKVEKTNDRLFTKADGTPMNPDSFTDWLAKFCDKYGIRRINLNMLRKLERFPNIAYR